MTGLSGRGQGEIYRFANGVADLRETQRSGTFFQRRQSHGFPVSEQAVYFARGKHMEAPLIGIERFRSKNQWGQSRLILLVY
jgi:hypothetical protein